MEVPGRTAGASFNDNIDAGSVEESNVLCQPCGSDGDCVTAIGYCENCTEYFCAACVKLHRKQAISKHHTILDGDQMPKDLFQESDACKDLCTIHKNELVRFYCQTHDVVGCGDCRILDHKECDVSLIKEVSDAYLQSRELGEIHEKISKLRRNISTIKKGIDNKGQSLNDNHDQILDEIKAFRKELNESLDRMETEIKIRANKLKREKESNLSDVEERCATLETEVNELEKHLKVQSSNNEHFVKAKRTKQRLKAIGIELESMEAQSKVVDHKFERDRDLTESIYSEKSLGEILPIPPKPVDKLEANYVGEINIKQPNDTVCYITDMVQTETGKAILVDRNNTCVKVVDINKKIILSVFDISNRPFGIAMVNPDLVVVTIPAAQKIQFLTYKNELQERYSLEVSGECIGIDCRSNLLALTYTNPSKVEIMTLTGTVLHTITVNHIQIPSYIVFGQEPKTVLISNYHKGTVKKYNFSGTVLSSYKDKYLENPAGLMITKGGAVLICNAGEGHSVHIMTSNCKKIKDMLKPDVDHIESPRCLLFCEETSRFYVCNGTGSLAQNCNTLKVYQC